MHKIKMNMITKSGKIWQDCIKYPNRKAKTQAVEQIKMLEETLQQELGKKDTTATFKFGGTQICISEIAVISFIY